MEVTATEIKNNFGHYLDKVIQGNQDVVVSKNGKKVARLTPYITDIEKYFTVRENAIDYQYGGKKVSYEEYMKIIDNTNIRMEYINEEIHLLAAPTLSHQRMLGRLHLIFVNWFMGKKCQTFIAPVDVHFTKKDIKEPDVMQPDLLVACDTDTTVDEKDRYMGIPILVLEILSDSTRSKDMVEKLNTYLLSGVKEYWIIDDRYMKIMIYQFNDYEVEQVKVYEVGGIASSFCFEGLSVNVSELFMKG